MIEKLTPIFPQYMRDGGGAQRALPVAANAQDGTVGEARVHPHFASAAGDAAADVPVRDAAPHQPRDAASGLLPLPADGPLAGRAHRHGAAEAAVQGALPQRGIVLVPQVSRERRNPNNRLSLSISLGVPSHHALSARSLSQKIKPIQKF
jgi:hypothetical protein